MSGPRPEHGFTRVDDDVRPATWVECPDKLHAEPFYRAYKDRIRAILAPAGTGSISRSARVWEPMPSRSERE